jgi:hypothetical protein
VFYPWFYHITVTYLTSCRLNAETSRLHSFSV